MEYDEALQEGIRLVHTEPDLSFFEGSHYTSENTNCYSAALGWTSCDFTIVKSPGCICNKRCPNDPFPSVERMNELVFEDLKILKLNPVSIQFRHKYELIDIVESYALKENQYIIVFFLSFYPANGQISDFHFVRFDVHNRWYEKQGRSPLRYLKNIRGYDWPNRYEPISAYLLER